MGLFSSKKKKQVVGYRYYIGMHMIAGHAHMDGCEKIRVGDKVAWTQSDVLKDNYTNIVTSHSLSGDTYQAQTFTTTSSYTLSGVEFMCWRNLNAYPGTCYVTLRATDGTGKPTGPDLARGTFDGDAVIEQPASLSLAEWTMCLFDDPIILENNTKYALVSYVLPYSSVGFGGLNFNADNNDANYTGGTLYTSSDGISWSQQANEDDVLFKCYKKDGDAPNSTITIDADSLFGGNRKDGGISGNVDLEFGASDQTQNPYLAVRLDDDIPAHRGVFGAVLNQVYIGTSSYLKPWKFMCKRTCKQVDGTDQWYKEKAVINPRQSDGDDLNAAHIIRECLIAPEWGLGWSAADIDDESFKIAANILYDEDFGLSMLWDQVEPMEDFVDEILNYIAGLLYQDLSTGKWVLTLTRDNDYETAYDGYTAGDNANGQISFPGSRYFAQTFTVSRSYSANSCKIKIAELNSSNTFDVRCEIQGVDGNGDPDGIVLAQGTILNADISDTASWVSCIFHKKANLIVNTQYCLVVRPIAGVGTLYWRVNTFGQYKDEHYYISNDAGSNWTRVVKNDFMFEIYAGGELVAFDEDAVTAIEDFTRPAYGEIVDSVTVKFWDKVNHVGRSTEDRDIALIAKQNGIVIEKILNYQGICNADLANAVAARELKIASGMLAAIRISCTRAMAYLKPNDVFIFSWAELGITQMALRVLNANYGSLHKNGVVLTCAEDEFAAAPTIYGAAPDTEMSEPVSDAVDVVSKQIIEIPYWSLVNDVYNSKDVVAALDDDFTRMGIVAGKPVSDAFDFDLWTRFTASYEYLDVGQGNTLFCPHGTLTDGLAQSGIDVDITLATDVDLDDVMVGSYAIIGNEYVMINSVDTTTKIVNISRAVLDTTPELHSSGDVIYFASLHYSDVDEEYTAADSPDAKLLTRTGNGSLAIDDATAVSATVFDSRQIRPYPPGNLKFNGESFPSHVSSGANGAKITLTWNHRDRTHTDQLKSMILHTAAVNYGPEAGVTYTIKIYGEADTLGRTVSGLSAATVSYEYTEAFEISDFGALQETLRFVVYAVRGGYNSWRDGYNVTIQRSMRSSISAQSGLTGDLSGWLEGAISAISEAEGILDVIPLYRGQANAVSNIPDADLNIQPQLIGSISAESDVIGYMEHIPDPALLVDYYTSGMSSSQAVSWSGPNDNWVAQTFTASEDYTIEDLVLKLYRNGIDPGTVTVSIQDVDGVGKPTGVDLCCYTINCSYFTQDSNGQEYTFHFHSSYCEGYPVNLENGTKYAIVLKSPTNENAEIHWINDHAGSTYTGGHQMISNDAGANWTINVLKDLYFKTFK